MLILHDLALSFGVRLTLGRVGYSVSDGGGSGALSAGTVVRARVDLELSVDVAQMPCNGYFGCDKTLIGDLTFDTPFAATWPPKPLWAG